MKNIADHGDSGEFNAVDAGGAPRFEPGIVGDIVAQHALVFGGHVGHRIDESDVANKRGREPVGGVVGGARTGCTVKVNEDAAVQGENEVAHVGGRAEDVGGGGVATVGSVVGLQAVAAGVHFFNDRALFVGEEQR